MSHREFKQRLYAEFARISNALASERRLEFVDLLAQGPRRVDSLAAETGLSVANASQHLQVLRRARLVDAERQGTSMLYRLADESVLDLWMALRRTGESRLAEIGELRREFGLEDTEGRLTFDELAELQGSGDVVVLDVRPRNEFESGHLPGALCIPVEELGEQLESLPQDRRIVAYCRGQYCLFADEAVDLLKQHGFDAVRLDEGWIEWRSRHDDSRDVEAAAGQEA